MLTSTKKSEESGLEFEASAKYHFRFPQRRPVLALDVSVKGKIQRDYGVL